MKKKVESYNVGSPSSAPAPAASGTAPTSTGGVLSVSAAVAPAESILFEDLKPIATLGKGSFGHVQLVQHRKTGVTYALKAVNKAQIVQTGQQGHVLSEKRVMVQLNHPFLVKLHATYKNQCQLFFLMDVAMGGELFSVLREKTLFDEDTARFFAASVLLAFEAMHASNIVYRVRQTHLHTHLCMQMHERIQQCGFLQ